MGLETENIPSADSVPRCFQLVELGWSETRSFFRFSHMGSGSTVLRLSPIAFSGTFSRNLVGIREAGIPRAPFIGW